MHRHLVIAALLASLAGCDMLGIDSPEKIAAVKEAEGKAVGAACRHAARAIEDCFVMNKKADKAAVFAGWKEMNDYMRENKIEPVTPQGAVALASAAKPPPAEEASAPEDAKKVDKAEKADKPAGKKAAARRES